MYRKDESRILVFSRKHESRILVFLLEGFIDPFCFYRFWKRQNGNIENRNRRNRKHESRILTFSRKHESRILVFYWRILLILFVFIVFRKARMKKQKTGIGAIENMNLAFSRFRKNTNLAFSHSRILAFSHSRFLFQVSMDLFCFHRFLEKPEWNYRKQEKCNRKHESRILTFSRKHESRILAFSFFILGFYGPFLFLSFLEKPE